MGVQRRLRPLARGGQALQAGIGDVECFVAHRIPAPLQQARGKQVEFQGVVAGQPAERQTSRSRRLCAAAWPACPVAIGPVLSR